MYCMSPEENRKKKFEVLLMKATACPRFQLINLKMSMICDILRFQTQVSAIQL